MLRRTQIQHVSMPRNMGVAPRFDTWNEKYEAWGALRRMSKLAGTGFYIPPQWYQHFRMFPPANHNFTEEKTQNPFNSAEETQLDNLSTSSAQRDAVRKELGEKSRSLAAEGHRYTNLFWVKKPMDEMERHYFLLTKSGGLRHDEAIKKVLQEFHQKQTVKKRVQLIQAEEAKLSGGFITMKEAMSVLNVLNEVQSTKMAPYQYAEMERRTSRAVLETPVKTAAMVTSRRAVVKPSVAEDKEGDDKAEATDAAKADGKPAESKLAPEVAEALKATKLAGGILAGEGAEAESVMELFEELAVSDAPAGVSGAAGLREGATDATGDASWYTGAGDRPLGAAPGTA